MDLSSSNIESNNQVENIETRAQLDQRHKKEQRDVDLHGRFLVKQAGKNKKKIGEAEATILRMRYELRDRHIEELNAIEELEQSGLIDIPQVEPQSKDTSEQIVLEESEKRKLKAQRKREMATEKQKLREKAIEIERAAAQSSDPRVTELEALRAQLEPLNLSISPIKSDGHCLYRAVAHQLQLTKASTDLSEEYYLQVRKDAAAYLRANVQEFLPFMEIDNENAFEEYCDKVESSAEWGGDLELRAISSTFGVPIQVWRASSQPIIFGEDCMPSMQVLRLSYHEHYFALGAHYNSIIPVQSL